MFEIIDLADRPDLIPACATWNFGEWGEFHGGTLEQTVTDFQNLVQANDGQVARIALFDGELAGIALLIDNDLETHPHLKPWVASVFVLPGYRGRGIAKSLVGAIEKAAAELGHGGAYLYTDKPDLYRQIGWVDFEQLDGDYAGMLIMNKKIAR